MLHDILKDFKGSQDGRFAEQFKAGTQADLSPYLAGIVVPEGWARAVEAGAGGGGIENKAVISDGAASTKKIRKNK